MSKSDWKYLIPGLNILFMIKDMRDFERWEVERRNRELQMQAESEKITLEVRNLVAEREKAKEEGDTARYNLLNDKITGIVTGYINKLLAAT